MAQEDREELDRADWANLDNWFSHHPPRDDQQVLAYQKIRAAGLGLAAVVLHRCPEGRERDTSIEKIREAVMWANAGIACGEPS